jgi:hypothetical protein
MSVNWGLSGQVTPDPYGHFMAGREQAEARRRQQEEEARTQRARSVNEAAASAIGQGDYGALSNVAAKSGDPQMAQQANSLAQREHIRQAVRFQSDLERIASLQDPMQMRGAYQRWYGTVRSTAQRMGLTDPERVAAFEQMFPDPTTATPEAIAAAAQQNAQLTSNLMLENSDDPAAQWSEQQTAQLQALRDERRYEIDQARLDQGERRLEALAARQSGGGGELTTPQFNRANTLRDEYNQLTATYRNVADSVARSEAYYARVRNNPSARSGQGDIGLVYAVAKLYDPTSVVREGEFNMVNAQGSVIQRMRTLWQRASSAQGLDDNIRNALMREIRNAYTSARAQRDQLSATYEERARRIGVDPMWVIDDYEASGAASQGGGGGAGSSGALPPVAQRVVGQTYHWTTRSGEPAQGVWNGQGFD